ncbi:hypothetical protein AVEN_139430-1 [Araneus ventricosus]|uniref:RNase H type-1 domain-containing protein n=1 Tax=Araneus ventricosus TaxID=182803 RepID=A0A4Y2SDC5_ARAVE|nr:hypothetical protein AVEN_139430-1 [Araneus ventricosus]
MICDANEEGVKEFVNNNSQNSFISATNASKSPNVTSITGFANRNSFVFRIHPINSIFTGEALTICHAIDDISIPEENLMILTDSLSALPAWVLFR